MDTFVAKMSVHRSALLQGHQSWEGCFSENHTAWKIVTPAAIMTDTPDYVVPQTVSSSSQPEIASESEPVPDPIKAKWDCVITAYTDERINDEMRVSERATLTMLEEDAFPSLPIDETNTHDMLDLYEKQVWRTNSTCDCPAVSRSDWQTMKKTLGQFVFHCVYQQRLKIEKICEPWTLFDLFSLTNVVDSFIRHYVFCSVMPCGSQAQLVEKLQDLLPVAELAENIEADSEDFSETYLGNLGQSASNIRYVLQRTVSTLNAALPHQRIGFLRANDFPDMVKSLENRCTVIIESWRNTSHPDKDIFCRWVRTFLTLMVISSPGFDPQLYTHVTIPTADRVRDWRNLSLLHQRFFVLLPVAPVMSYPATSVVALHSRILPFLLFHLDVFLPAVRNRSEPPLLSHGLVYIFPSPTMYGLCGQMELQSIVLKFISFYKRDKSTVTLQQLRASYIFHMLSIAVIAPTVPESYKHQIYNLLAYVLDKTPHRVKSLAQIISTAPEQEGVWMIQCALDMDE